MNRAFIFLILILLFIEFYSYRGLSQWMSVYVPEWKKMAKISYWVFSAFVFGMFIYTIIQYKSGVKDLTALMNFTMGLFVVVFLPKLIFSVIHLIDDIFFGVKWIGGKFTTEPVSTNSRRQFITTLGLGTGALMFGGLIYGIVRGKFNFRVLKEDIISDKIPQAFDGCRIVQISDAHLGSFVNNFEPIKKAVKMINDLEPDYVVFTGDMVNNNASEAVPWIDVFSEIKAKKGKFSIFGNHDYADYGGQSKEDKIKSIRLLKEVHAKMGFRLLEDEHVVLKEQQDAITLLGVHNWGHGFHQVGDLNKAMKGVNDEHFKILLSHDPTHYDHQVKSKTNIDLTLSGHTHGMQMGIEIPSLNIKWSPVSLRYKKWAGLYEENQQKLYVNRGFGVLAYPGRLGISPEITMLTLKSGQV